MLKSKKLPQIGVNKILIRGTNWIGDAILTLPALASIRATYPQAHIAVLAKSRVADIYRLFSAVDEVIIYENKFDNVCGVLQLAFELKKKKFDLAILLQNAIEAAIMVFIAGIPLRAGYNSDCRGLLLTHSIARSEAIRQVHQIDYYLEMVKALGCLASGGELHLETKIKASAARVIQDKYLPREGNPINEKKNIVGIAPGATYGPAKKWFPARFAAVADRIAESCNSRIVILGGKSDEDAAKEVCAKAKTKIINLAGKTNLTEAVYLIAQCNLFISNDSGLMHIAGALNIPTIAIFGSTNPATTSPVGNQSVIIRKDVTCSPCLKENCPTDFRCMELITVEDVYKVVQQLLSKNKGSQ